MKELIKYRLLQVVSVITLLLTAPLFITAFILVGVALFLGNLCYLVWWTHDFLFENTLKSLKSQVDSNECTDVRVEDRHGGEENCQKGESATPNEKPSEALESENARSDLVLLEEVTGKAIQLCAQGVCVGPEVTASPLEV